MITLICPICNKPVGGQQYEDHYTFMCVSRDAHAGHIYGASAATEAEAHAILYKAQKIALPIEQRRHNEARTRLNQATTIVADFFSHTVMTGLQERPPRTWLYGWERRALEWLRARKSSVPICAWTASYIKHGPPPWGDKK